ncbi:GMC oxidoreductase [Dinoroseobacter sp. S375]|uniref:GMC family oxidoreductase n=1 Tax=Dinoroseobacter sp. S375 TaxID=3415136 RepID=UPI003C7A4B21
MLLASPDLETLTATAWDVTVIGAGPVGLNLACALADKGQRVLVLESGEKGPTDAAQDLAADALHTPDTHYTPEITVARRLGGASNLWGGRCVPFDGIDFAPRPWIEDLPDWPVTETDLAPYLAPACAALGAGEAVFHDPVPGLDANPPGFETDRLERWTNQPRAQVVHQDRIETDPKLVVALGVTVTGMDHGAEEGVTALHLWSPGWPARSETPTLPVRQVVLAAGGNASTRLLLALQAETPALFGGPDGPLGRYYMGHVNGQIADIVFENDALHDAMNFYVDAHGSYVRRRITPTEATQKDHALANVAFWPVVPEISQAEHRSGPLSAVFLALSLPGLGSRLIAEPIRLKHMGPKPWTRGPHLRNVLGDLLRTASFVPWFLWNRHVARHRIPGFFLENPGKRYGLEFHSEHLPGAESRLTLSEARDASGLRRLEIDFRFSERDVETVLRAHDALDAALTASGLGRLVYRYEGAARAEGVLVEARHGNHQVGTIRMGSDPRHAVVDGWGTSFDLPNLHVASTAILPTSSQANPTLAALQLGLRLVDKLTEQTPAVGAPGPGTAREARPEAAPETAPEAAPETSHA